MREFIATNNDDGMRLSRFVLRVTTGMPTSAMHKNFRNRRIKINGKRAYPQDILVKGDCIQLYINDSFFAAAPTSHPAPKKQPPVDVVWQDDNIAILYKPAGLLSHSDDEGGGVSLLGAYTQSLVQSGEYQPQKENTFAPALCNRLDRNTEGLVIAAKTFAALQGMNELIRLGHLQKIYLCVAAGTPPEGRHNAYLMRDKAAKKVLVSARQAPGYKPIATAVHVLEKCSKFSLCEVELLTGRTHQIRAHLAFLGAPLAGDAKYGGPPLPFAPPGGKQGQLLCAYKLTLPQQLPASSNLQYLAGQTFVAANARLPQLWAQFKAAQKP